MGEEHTGGGFALRKCGLQSVFKVWCHKEMRLWQTGGMGWGPLEKK